MNPALQQSYEGQLSTSCSSEYCPVYLVLQLYYNIITYYTKYSMTELSCDKLEKDQSGIILVELETF